MRVVRLKETLKKIEIQPYQTILVQLIICKVKEKLFKRINTLINLHDCNTKIKFNRFILNLQNFLKLQY
jgi:hypothetical protein